MNGDVVADIEAGRAAELARLQGIETRLHELRARWADSAMYGNFDERREVKWRVEALDKVLKGES